MSKEYIVYKTDLKFKKLRNIDPSKAIWYNDEVKDDYYNNDFDSINYRLKECKLNNFDSLDLSHLGLTKFPDFSSYKYYDIMRKNLNCLFLNDNDIENIGDELLKFYGLEVLDISSNKLSELKNIPKTLVELVCHNNFIVSIESNLSLKNIDCSHNKLKFINYYPKLECLICENNKIEKIQSFENIDKIICRNNPLDSLGSQPRITYLDISHTKLSGKIPFCPQLKYLLCSETLINNIDNLQTLEVLEMVESKIKYISFIPSLKEIVFSNTEEIQLSEKFKAIRYVEEHGSSYIQFKQQNI